MPPPTEPSKATQPNQDTQANDSKPAAKHNPSTPDRHKIHRDQHSPMQDATSPNPTAKKKNRQDTDQPMDLDTTRSEAPQAPAQDISPLSRRLEPPGSLMLSYTLRLSKPVPSSVADKFSGTGQKGITGFDPDEQNPGGVIIFLFYFKHMNFLVSKFELSSLVGNKHFLLSPLFLYLYLFGKL